MMTDLAHAQVQRARTYLLTSELEEDSKDGLSTLLDSSETAGTYSDAAVRATDSTERAAAMASAIRAQSEAILALAKHEIRQAVRTPAARREAIAEHVALVCPLKGTGKWSPLVAIAMKPWCWLALAVGLFSPNFPAFIEAIIKGVTR